MHPPAAYLVLDLGLKEPWLQRIQCHSNVPLIHAKQIHSEEFCASGALYARNLSMLDAPLQRGPSDLNPGSAEEYWIQEKRHVKSRINPTGSRRDSLVNPP